MALPFSQSWDFLVTFGSLLSLALHVRVQQVTKPRSCFIMFYIWLSPLLVQIYCVLDLDYFRSLFPGFLPLMSSPCSKPVQCHRLHLPETSFYHVIHSCSETFKGTSYYFSKTAVKTAGCLPRAKWSVCIVVLRPYCSPLGVTPVLPQFWRNPGAGRVKLDQGGTGGFLLISVWLQSPWWRICVEKVASGFRSWFSI